MILVPKTNSLMNCKTLGAPRILGTLEMLEVLHPSKKQKVFTKNQKYKCKKYFGKTNRKDIKQLKSKRIMNSSLMLKIVIYRV